MEPEDNRPKWLMELESRKRKPRLAHEAGAGAPCINCTTCPGLELHFWRKTCKKCKCGRDDHDFEDDEFPQFNLLFGVPRKLKKRTFSLPDKKQNDHDSLFEWLPPDTSDELVVDYMQALPSEKLPVKGTAGAAFRRQQLQKQLPLHDVNYKVCDDLSEYEKSQFVEYLENLKNYVGRGKVTKVLGARPFSRTLMTPANATDVQRSPQHNTSTSPGQDLHLRTPSSFIPKDFPLSKRVFVSSPESLPLFNATPANLESLPSQDLFENPPSDRCLPIPDFASSDTNSAKSLTEQVESVYAPKLSRPFTELLRRHAKAIEARSLKKSNKPAGDSSSENNDSSQEGSFLPGNQEKNDISGGVIHPEEIISIDSQLEQARFANAMLAEALLPPSTILIPSSQGTLSKEELKFIKDKLELQYSNRGDVGHRDPFESRELKGHQRPNIANEEDVKFDWKNVIRQIEKQDPQLAKEAEAAHAWLQKDVLPESLRNYNPSQAALEESSTNHQRSFSVDQNLPPASFSKPNGNSNLSLSYFPCAENIEPLQAEFSNCGSIASNVITSEILHNPIFPGEATYWTSENATDVDRLARDVENLGISTAKHKCHKCKKQINMSEVVITIEKAKNEVWHPGCFVCSVCNELLADLVYFFNKGNLYCGRDLASHLNIQRCFACDELIFTPAYTMAEGHFYHVKHFCCWNCDKPLAGNKYTPENDRPLCLPCYQNTYAKTCSACNEAIAADQSGVAIKDLDFHVDEKCFCCFTCKKSLINGKVAIRENKLFCCKECIAEFLSQQQS